MMMANECQQSINTGVYYLLTSSSKYSEANMVAMIGCSSKYSEANMVTMIGCPSKYSEVNTGDNDWNANNLLIY